MCMKEIPTTKCKVYYGSHNRNHANRKHGEIEQIVVHPDYDGGLKNNLVLIKLRNDIIFIPTVVIPAKLSTRETMENETVYAIGWDKVTDQVSDFHFRDTYQGLF